MTTTVKIVVSAVSLAHRAELEKLLLETVGDANIIRVQHGADVSTYKLLTAHFQAWNGIPELADACCMALRNAATQNIHVELAYASTESFGTWIFENAYIGYDFQACSGDITPQGHPQGQLLAFLEKHGMALNWN